MKGCLSKSSMSQAHNGAFSKSVEDSEDVENELGKWVAHSGSHLGIDKMHRIFI